MPRRAGPVAVVAALLLLTTACRTTPPAGSGDATIDVGGTTRTYHLHRPAEVADPAPLVVVLHGGFGSGTQAEGAYGWDAVADREHFVVAYPDGLDRAWDTGGGCCGAPGRDGVDDVGFIVAMIDQIGRDVPIDARRIYATGMSNGGIMAYTLACRTDVLAAIGPVAATRLGACPAPAPVSVIHVHGTADTSVPYLGGPGSGVAHIDGPPVPDLVASWRAVDGCAAPSVTTAGAVTTSTATCPDGRAVELVTVAGAGHQWPGSVGRTANEPSTAIDATAVLWSFFAAHPHPPG